MKKNTTPLLESTSLGLQGKLGKQVGGEDYNAERSRKATDGAQNRSVKSL